MSAYGEKCSVVVLPTSKGYFNELNECQFSCHFLLTWQPKVGASGESVKGGWVGGSYVPFRNSKGEQGRMVPICLPVDAMERFEKELDETFKMKINDSNINVPSLRDIYA
ncbi:benzyl alcohol O-benzoyltransferase [Sesbania bispinosa]|nr:benzyl alcohol O-benzoyltransferase [Sesbania bispinosa]